MKNTYLYNMRRKLQIIILKLTSMEFISRVYFRIVLGEKLDLKMPKTFNEKIQWLKLYYWPKQPRVCQCADKLAVRAYVKEKGFANYLNDLYGVWEKLSDLDWDSLPKQFVLKCNHGCGYNIICADKDQLNIKEEKEKLVRWLKEDFSLYNAEPHYAAIPRRIICEKYLGEHLTDYKFFCFHGKVKFMYIASGFGSGQNEQITFFDAEGKKAPYKRGDYPEIPNAELPVHFKQMLEMSEALAEEFPFVRVDLFEVNGDIYFSELTFTPCAGLMKIEPRKYDRLWGNELDLETLKGVGTKDGR